MRIWMSLAAAVCVIVSVGAQGQTASGRSVQTTPAQSVAAPAAKPDACEAMQKKLDDWPQLGRYAAENAALTAAEPGRVVFYGDSITDAWGRRPDTGEFFPGKPYVNRGISGQTTEQMVVRFRQDVIDLHPQTVVILAGTNDIAGNTGPETPETIEDDFRSMVDLARANHIRVILASITPTDHYPWKLSAGDPADEIRQINEWMKGYCEENHITYLDYWSAMAGPTGGMKPGISKDGVHPNTKGYAIMTPLAEAALAK
jgi:lysophospholipase L1-like esterase